MYTIKFSVEAQRDVIKLQNRYPEALKKLIKLLPELKEHPRSGTGKVERLKHYTQETWSRRLTKEHRVVYRIDDYVVEVLVISAFGHYE